MNSYQEAQKLGRHLKSELHGLKINLLWEPATPGVTGQGESWCMFAELANDEMATAQELRAIADVMDARSRMQREDGI